MSSLFSEQFIIVCCLFLFLCLLPILMEGFAYIGASLTPELELPIMKLQFLSNVR